MKKRTKKLVLGRETLKQLEAAPLSEAAGGLTVGASACVTHCVYPTNANVSVCKKCYL